MERDRGGCRQREAKRRRRDAGNEGGGSPSALAGHLLHLWSWGVLTAQSVQKIAAFAQADIRKAESRARTIPASDVTGDAYPDLAMLEALGSRGLHSNNCHRDLVKHVNCRCKDAAIHVQVPLRTGFNMFKLFPTAMMLPHIWFSLIFHNYASSWTSRIYGSAERLRLFWSEMARSPTNPIYANHPVRARADHKTKCIPFTLHGDAVPVVGVGKCWSRSLFVFSFASLLGYGSTTEMNFLIWAMWELCLCKMAAGHTLNRFHKLLCWSLKALWEGRWPTHDADGKPLRDGRAGTWLAGGFYAVPWYWLGDLEHWAKVYKLPHFSSNKPCVCCPADCNDASLPWTDFRENAAAWMTRIWTPAAWLAAFPVHHIIFDLPFVSILNIAVDWMHVKLLGTDMYLFGSVLWILVYMLLPNSPEENMDAVETLLLQYFVDSREYGCFSNIKISMFTNPLTPRAKYPKLKGKAGEIKTLGPALLHVWSHYMDARNAVHRRIRATLQLTVEANAIVANNRGCFRMSGEDARRLRKVIFDFLSLYNALASYYMQAATAERLFDVTIKFHYLAHLALSADQMNFHLTWCFAGEDFMQHTKRLMTSAVRGNSPQSSSAKMMQKYLIAMHVAMQRHAS